MFKQLSIIFIIIFSNVDFSLADTVKFIGLDHEGKEIQAQLSAEEFKERFSAVVESFESSAANSLELKSFEKSKWIMNKVYVGGSLNAALGIGPVVEASFEPSFYLILKK